MILLILLLWFVMIGCFVYADRNGRKPNYFQMLIIRACAAMAHVIILDLVCDYFPDGGWEWSDSWMMLKLWIPVLLFQATSFWIVFELALNIIRKRELLYFDRKEHDSGWIDKIFDVLGNGAHLAAKLAALVICILSIMSLYHHAL